MQQATARQPATIPSMYQRTTQTTIHVSTRNGDGYLNTSSINHGKTTISGLGYEEMTNIPRDHGITGVKTGCMCVNHFELSAKNKF